MNLYLLLLSLTESERNEERMLNYERYRTLVQNEAVGSKFLDPRHILDIINVCKNSIK